ncbi:MAG: Gfo/Idh/MocA family oxidoreductase, partial [Planctomycetota bacterium]
MQDTRRPLLEQLKESPGKTNRRLTRRQFLGTATALAAPLVVPSGALGLNGDAPPSERVTLGFIGTGGRGTGNMRAFLPLASAQVVAVCDVNRDKREAAARIVAQHYAAGGRGSGKPCDAYNDFRELLARDDLDAVVICPQDHWHAPIA